MRTSQQKWRRFCHTFFVQSLVLLGSAASVATCRAFSWLKALVAALNQEKALVGAFSVNVQLCRLIVFITSHHADRVGHVVADEVRVLEGLHAEAAVVAARVRQRAHRARRVQAQAAGPRHLAPEADVDPGPGKLEIIFRCLKNILHRSRLTLSQCPWPPPPPRPPRSSRAASWAPSRTGTGPSACRPRAG